MRGKPFLLHQAVAGSARGGVQHHPGYRIRMGDGEGKHRGAAHAAAHEERPADAEMIEQPPRLANVVGPGEPLYPTTGKAGFATVEGDAAKAPAQRAHQVQARVDADRAPALDGRVEPPR